MGTGYNFISGAIPPAPRDDDVATFTFQSGTLELDVNNFDNVVV